MDDIVQLVIAVGLLLCFAMLGVAAIVWVYDVRGRVGKTIQLAGQDVTIEGYPADDACDLIELIAETQADPEPTQNIHGVRLNNAMAHEDGWWLNLMREARGDGVTEVMPKTGDLAAEPEYVDPGDRPEVSDRYAKLSDHAPKGSPSPRPRPKHELHETHDLSDYYRETDCDDTDARSTEA